MAYESLMVFTGNANVPMTLTVADDNSIFWQNSTGQLFSISNNTTTGSIFSVADISGIPAIDVNASGNIALGHFGGNVAIGGYPTSYTFQVCGSTNLGVASNVTIGGVGATTGNVLTYGAGGTLCWAPANAAASAAAGRTRCLSKASLRRSPR